MQKNIELSTEPQGRQPSEEEEELDFSINILAESQERELNGDIEIPIELQDTEIRETQQKIRILEILCGARKCEQPDIRNKIPKPSDIEVTRAEIRYQDRPGGESPEKGARRLMANLDSEGRKKKQSFSLKTTSSLCS